MKDKNDRKPDGTLCDYGYVITHRGTKYSRIVYSPYLLGAIIQILKDWLLHREKNR